MIAQVRNAMDGERRGSWSIDQASKQKGIDDVHPNRQGVAASLPACRVFGAMVYLSISTRATVVHNGPRATRLSTRFTVVHALYARVTLSRARVPTTRHVSSVQTTSDKRRPTRDRRFRCVGLYLQPDSVLPSLTPRREAPTEQLAPTMHQASPYAWLHSYITHPYAQLGPALERGYHCSL
jgi:hypothetical protein